MPTLISDQVTPQQNSAQPLGDASDKAGLVREARALGFDTIRVTRPEAIGDAGDRLRADP